MQYGNIKSRPSLSFEQAVQVWLLRKEGLIQSVIAQMLSTNQGRVNEVLKERKHKGSRAAAGFLTGPI